MSVGSLNHRSLDIWHKSNNLSSSSSRRANSDFLLFMSATVARYSALLCCRARNCHTVKTWPSCTCTTTVWPPCLTYLVTPASSHSICRTITSTGSPICSASSDSPNCTFVVCCLSMLVVDYCNLYSCRITVITVMTVHRRWRRPSN